MGISKANATTCATTLSKTPITIEAAKAGKRLIPNNTALRLELANKGANRFCR
jgi:hypothetical protein